MTAAFQIAHSHGPVDVALRSLPVPRNLAADNRVALLEARMTGANTGPFHLSETERLLLGTQAEALPATGRATDISGVVVLEVAGDRVTAERHYWPLVDGLMQLGLIGPR